MREKQLMRAAMMDCAKSSDAYENKILSKQTCLSLISRNLTRITPLHLQSTDIGRVMTSTLQEANGVSFVLAVYAILASLHNTPPHVGIFQYRNVRRKPEARTPGIWCQRTPIFEESGWPISQKDPQKDGNRPPPTKPETEPQKSDGDGKKGKRKGKGPRTK